MGTGKPTQAPTGGCTTENSPVRGLAVVGFAANLLLSMLVVLPAVVQFFSGTQIRADGSATGGLGYTEAHDIVFPLVFFALFALYWKRPRWPRRSTPLLVAMVAGYAVPGAMSLLLAQQPSFVAVSLVPGALTATGQALGYILWQQVFSLGRGRGIAVEVASGTALAGALYFIVTWFPAAALVPFTYLFVGVSCLALVALLPQRRDGGDPDRTAAASLNAGLALCIKSNWAAILVIALIGFVWGIFQILSSRLSTPGYLSGLYALGRIAAALLVVSYLALKRYRLDLGVFIKLVLPICVTATLLYPIVGEAVCPALAAMYYIFFGVSSMAMIIFCADLSRSVPIHPSIPYCLFFGLIYLFSKAGLYIGRVVTESVRPADNLTFELVVALVAVYLFAMLGFVLQRQFANNAAQAGAPRDPERQAPSDCLAPPATAPAPTARTEAPAPSHPSPAQAAADRREEPPQDLLGAYGLTPRETEVAMFLLKGRDVAYICEALTLSKNTVRSHIKNVYQKTGVHGKQELISLSERFHEGGGAFSDGASPTPHEVNGVHLG